jgi:outer membrane receptor protein involved in Fe transport
VSLRPLTLLFLSSAIGAAPVLARADEPASQIVVVATPLNSEASAVADAEALRVSRATNLGEQLARTAPGVSINEIQGNPLQPDISYRGFTASPLLGTPQGLSVYLDGVRINQPFGDVVSWDLIGTNVVRSIDLVSGAAPQFGRNSLGGALAVRTKDGNTDPGFEAAVSYGSFDRLRLDGQVGGHADTGFNWFLAADHFRENGWRDFSPSQATHAFAKLGWSGADSDVALSGSFADTDLNGNGLQEMRLLEADRSSIYTAPDNTRNRSSLVNVNGSHHFSDHVNLRGNVYWRRVKTRTLNGDVNQDALGENLYQPTAAERAVLAATGYTGFPLAGETQANTPFPKWRCIANVLLNTEPNEKCNGLANRSATDQDEWGGGLELAVRSRLGGIEHHLSLGLAYTNSRAHFEQSSQFGYLLPDRTVATVDGPGAFADGSQASENAFDARVDLRTRTESFGAYVLESAQLAPSLRFDLAGRYDRTAIHNRDQITPGGGPGSLDSNPVYDRFNPAVALAVQPARGVDLSLSWAQASRAPSAIELGCSDPASPCRLPNALAGDPPLKQVIARTVEAKAGVRREHWSLSLSAFRTDSNDDILFVTDDPSGFGYFKNFGKTRRQGIEVDGSIALGMVSLSANYTFLDATYRSPETVDGSANSANDGHAPGFEGAITIIPGNRIALIPRHLFKAALSWRPLGWLSLNADMVALSGVIARGNENNLHQPDGIYYLGPGKTDGYAVLNLGGEVRPVQHLSLFFALRNVFDKRYATAAQLGQTAFDAQGNFVARPFAGPVINGELPLLSSTFYAPSAPRSIEVGARLRF